MLPKLGPLHASKSFSLLSRSLFTAINISLVSNSLLCYPSRDRLNSHEISPRDAKLGSNFVNILVPRDLFTLALSDGSVEFT